MVSFGADIEDDIDTLADALHIKIQDGRLSGLDVYVLLHRIEYGRLYFLQVFIVRIEIGQVIALYDVGLFIAHTADLQIKVFHAYLIVVDVIVQIFYADDGSRGLLRIACLCRNIRILLVDDKNVVLTSAQVKKKKRFLPDSLLSYLPNFLLYLKLSGCRKTFPVALYYCLWQGLWMC